MQPSYVENRTLSFEVLSRDQRKEIHFTALAVLEEVGVIIKSPPVIEMLEKAGAFIEGERVKYPRALVEEHSARSFGLCPLRSQRAEQTSFRGKALLLVGTDHHLHDRSHNGERRLPHKKDTANAVRVMDALEISISSWISGLFRMFQIAMPIFISCRLSWRIRPSRSSTGGFDAANCRTILDMCLAISGSLKIFQKKPFLSLSCSSSPLLHTVDALEKLIFSAENKIPFVYVSAPAAGATSPVSLAGTLVVTLAECLAGLVVPQLVNEGAPLALGCVTGATDMQTMAMSYGCPEFNLMHAAFTELVHDYNIPLWGTAGCTDSKAVDQQAALESTASIMMSALSGANMVHDVGYLEGGNCSSLALLVV